jgi:uncharacterized membrane protein YfcA
LFFVLRYDLKTAIGTSTAVMLLVALAGAGAHMYAHAPDWHVALLIGAGSIVGGIVSSLYANMVKPELLSKVIALLFIILAMVVVIFNVV